jgi:hypothetical protein
MNSGTPRDSRPLLRVIAWTAVLASFVPRIIWEETGHRPTLWVPAAESIFVAVVALSLLAFPRLRGLTRFLLAIALVHLGWGLVAPAIAETSSVRAWANHATWGLREFTIRTFTLSGAALGALTLIRSGLTRRDLFLCVGNLAAPAQPIRFLGIRKPIPWTWFGPALIFVFGAVLAPFLYLTVYPNFGAGSRVLQFFPAIVAVAAMNAASEEFQFRCLLLGHLRGVFSPAENVLLVAAFFGLVHYFGQPSGPVGVAMAGFAGWIWARSMIETRGWIWALIVHFVQDILILSFLVVGAGR